MKFYKALPLALALSAFPVNAALFDSLQSGLSSFFDLAGTNISFLRLLMALLVFAVMYRPMLLALKDNQAAALIVSLIVSVIAVRFMPAEILLRLAAFLWIIVLFAVPYWLLGKLFHNVPARIIVAILAAGVLFYFVQGTFGFGIDFSLFVDLYYMFADSPSLFIFIIAGIIVAIALWKFMFKKKWV